jgi:hypothetical protein
VLRLISRREAAVEVSRPPLRCSRLAVEVSRLSDCELRALRLDTDIFYLLFKAIHRNTDY